MAATALPPSGEQNDRAADDAPVLCDGRVMTQSHRYFRAGFAKAPAALLGS